MSMQSQTSQFLESNFKGIMGRNSLQTGIFVLTLSLTSCIAYFLHAMSTRMLKYLFSSCTETFLSVRWSSLWRLCTQAVDLFFLISGPSPPRSSWTPWSSSAYVPACLDCSYLLLGAFFWLGELAVASQHRFAAHRPDVSLDRILLLESLSQNFLQWWHFFLVEKYFGSFVSLYPNYIFKMGL